jgi:hypothetical protein
MTLAAWADGVLPDRVGIQGIALDVEVDRFRQLDRAVDPSGTGTTPHFSQWTMGMGQPQGRCRDTSQSRKR